MTSYRRDPMDSTRRAHRAQKRDPARANMTDDMVEASLRRLIRERIERDGDGVCISLEDLRRANLPVEVAHAKFRSALAAVQHSMAMERA